MLGEHAKVNNIVLGGGGGGRGSHVTSPIN